jgi:hypothetical protein
MRSIFMSHTNFFYDVLFVEKIDRVRFSLPVKWDLYWNISDQNKISYRIVTVELPIPNFTEICSVVLKKKLAKHNLPIMNLIYSKHA